MQRRGVGGAEPSLERLPYGAQLHSAGIVPCFSACGEVYCSEACRGAAFERHHRLLCVGSISDPGHPLVRFKQHAVQKNELFLLAGQAIASIVSEWERNGRDLQRAMQPFAAMHRRPYWDVKSQSGVPAKKIQRMLQDSVQLLREALLPTVHGDASGLAMFFSLEFYANLLGLLEMNNHTIDLVSPLQRYLERLPDLPEPERGTAQRVLEPVVRGLQEEQLEDDDADDADDASDSDASDGPDAEDEMNESSGPADAQGGFDDSEEPAASSGARLIFPSFQGYGLYSFQAAMNHSCVPNCQTFYDADYRCVVRAIRDVTAGEELTISYIENERPLADRRADLVEYSFLCDCPKCAAESAASEH